MWRRPNLAALLLAAVACAVADRAVATASAEHTQFPEYGLCTSNGERVRFYFDDGSTLPPCKSKCAALQGCVAISYVDDGVCNLHGIALAGRLSHDWGFTTEGISTDVINGGAGVAEGEDTANTVCLLKVAAPPTTAVATVAADITPCGYNLLSPDGSDGHCRSGGKVLPLVAAQGEPPMTTWRLAVLRVYRN